MGKKRNKRFGAPKHHPTGVQIVNMDENDLANGCPVGAIADIISELQSPVEQTRDCACTRIASITGRPDVIAELLKSDVIRTLAPLVIDRVPSVRHRALGALRNMGVHGGLDACHEMVLKDVLTPLVALFKMYEKDWAPEKEGAKHTDTKLDTFREAVLLLWSLCEASDVAVSVFNKENLMSNLLPCLQHSVYGYPLATAVAQCLFTVTERNQAAIDICHSDQVLPSLQLLVQRSDNTSQAILFQAATMGVVMNVLGDKLTSSSGLSQFVAALGQILDIDLEPFVAMGNAKSHERHIEASGDAKQSRILVEDEDEAEYEDVVNILDAQCICLELSTNICSSPDEEWEEMENSSESSDDVNTVEMEDDSGSTDNNNHDVFGVPVEVHEALAAHHIVSKVLRLSLPVPQQLLKGVKMKKWSEKLTSKTTCLRCRALLCINNLLEGMPVENMGGIEALHQLWDSLTQQFLRMTEVEAVAGSAVSSHKSTAADKELLEAMVSAIRAVLQKLVPLNSPKVQQVSTNDVRMLTKHAESAERGVQIHVLRILASIALALMKTDPQHAVVQEVGGCLIAAATHSPDLVVVAEALDSLFDVFAEDATDPVKHTLQMTERLKPLSHQLRAKMQSQRKLLGEHYMTVKSSRDNLIRFIRYMESRPTL